MTECARVEEQIVDSLEGELPLEHRAAFESHVASCVACGDMLRSYRTILGAYRRLPDDDVDAVVAQRILEAAGAKHSRARRLRRPVVAAAACLVAVLLALYFSTRPRAGRVGALVASAEERRKKGDLQGAESAYEQALELTTDGEQTARLLHALAGVDVARGELERALERATAVVERYPEYGARREVLLLWARLLARAHRLDEAREAYALLVAEFPGAAEEFGRGLQDLSEQRELQALGYAGY